MEITNEQLLEIIYDARRNPHKDASAIIASIKEKIKFHPADDAVFQAEILGRRGRNRHMKRK